MALNTADQNPNTFNVLPASPQKVGTDRGWCSWFERPMTSNVFGDRIQIVDLNMQTFVWNGSEWVNPAFSTDANGNFVPVGPDGKAVLGSVTLVGSSISLVADQDCSIQVKAGGPSYAELIIPSTGQGSASVRSLDGSTVSISAVAKLGGIRLANSGSSIVLPSITLPSTADAGWTVGMLVRIEDDNLQAGTTSKQFLKVGSAPAYFSLGYEGPNASNPRCIKVLMPNAGATGVASGRTGAPIATSAFAAANIGQWVWLFIRKAGVAGSETALSASTGQSTSVTIADETISIAWAPLALDEPVAMTVSVASPIIASGNYSSATGALTVGSDSSVTGTCDISKVFVLQQFVSAANLNKLTTGKRPQDIGLTVTNATDVYYDLDSLTAAQLLDLLGGTAATSVTMAGSDALTPAASRPTTRKYIGDATFANSLEVMFADGTARGRVY